MKRVTDTVEKITVTNLSWQTNMIFTSQKSANIKHQQLSRNRWKQHINL